LDSVIQSFQNKFWTPLAGCFRPKFILGGCPKFILGGCPKFILGGCPKFILGGWESKIYFG
jgi:hypothetical protein